jgi:phosphatidylserine decarboxylase
MSVVSVHVNRAPCEATVEWVKPLDGTFLNAMRAESGLENVRTLIALRRPDGTPVLMKQIAGLIARRIICPLKPGDRLRRGERFGMIKFGSRVELFIPRDKPFDAQVRLGQFVKAGETTLGVWR